MKPPLGVEPSADQVKRLTRFLESDERSPECLDYHETCGFLFAMVCAPDLVEPSEWLPQVLGEDPFFRDRDEANAVLGALMAVYNWLNAAVLKGTVSQVLPRLPHDFGEYRRPEWSHSPTARWIGGFLDAQEWLGDTWVLTLAEAQEDPELILGGLETNLDFLWSADLGRVMLEEIGEPAENFESVFDAMKGDFVSLLTDFAANGRRLYLGRIKGGGEQPSES